MSPLADSLRARIRQYAQQAVEHVDSTTEAGLLQVLAVSNLEAVALQLVGVAARGEESLRAEAAVATEARR